MCGQEEGGVHARGWIRVEEGDEWNGLKPTLWSPGELLIEGGAEQCESGGFGLSSERG